jgi:flavin reductase (DIM6/NTAB) family NADH-FMN oxidoreductase RutF
MAVDDELLNRVTWKIPNALVLVGSRSGDERNAMTTSWVTQVSMAPVLIGVGIDNDAVTHRLISASGAFSVKPLGCRRHADLRQVLQAGHRRRVESQRSAGAHRHHRCSGVR